MENQPVSNPKAGQTMGVVALILGIVGVITALIPCFAWFAGLFSVLAIVFGIIGMNQAKKGNAKRGLPIAGLVLGIISAVFVVIWMTIMAEALMGVKSVVDELKADSTFQQSWDSMMQQFDTLQTDSIQ